MLVAEARIYGHHEHEIEVRQNFLQHSSRGGRVDGETDWFAQAFHALDGSVQIVVTFPMNDE